MKIKNCPNFRDFGGYRKQNGKLTQSGRIYRSDSLSKLLDEDIETLRLSGIRCIIDLRYATELEEFPNPFRVQEGFYYYNVSLSDGLYSGDFNAYMDESMWDMYISLIEEASEKIVRVFKIIAAHVDCGIVFHCTAGKDRTGVVAALLLLCAGVVKEDVVSDYAYSYELLKELLEADKANLRAKGITLKDHVFMSEPEYIERFISHIESKYTSADNYLLKSGLSQEELLIIKNLL